MRNVVGEAVSKPQIAAEGKARADEKAQAYNGSMLSILKRPSTQQSGARWGFEMASGI